MEKQVGFISDDGGKLLCPFTIWLRMFKESYSSSFMGLKKVKGKFLYFLGFIYM